MEHKKVAEMYWVLLLIKEDYEKDNIQEKQNFETYARNRINELFLKAFDWLIEDERESNNKIAQ